jgi:hypothetical protein
VISWVVERSGINSARSTMLLAAVGESMRFDQFD